MATKEGPKKLSRQLLSLIALLAVLILLWQQTVPVAYLQSESSKNLEAPSLSATYSSTNSVELSWTEVSGADHYDLRVWRNNQTGWESIGTDRYSGRTYVDDSLTDDRPEYFYIVAPVDANGVIGQWSNQVRVVASELLPAPTLTLNEIVDSTIELNWTEVSDADRYELWTWWATDPGWQRTESNLEDTSYSYGDLVPGRTYSFAVRAVDSDGQEGEWSNYPSATVPSAPTSTPELSSTPTSGPSQTPSSTPTSTSTSRPSLTPTSTHSPEPGQTLTPTPTPAVAVTIPAPTLAATIIGTTTVEISWTQITGADYYDLKVWRDSQTGWERIARGSYAGRTYLDDSLTSDRPAYFYIVAGVDANGVIGQWSNQVRVVASDLLLAPVLTLSEAVGNTIELSWTEVTLADSYEIWSWWNNDPGWQRQESNLQVTYYSHGGLVPGRTYYFAVRAVDANGEEGAWSNFPFATVPTTSQAQEAKERTALAALYEATDGPNWTLSGNWTSNEPLSTWYGVVTDTNGSVTELHLTGNGMTGTLPDLTPLSSLTTLSLGSNSISGTVPDLSKLIHLSVLDLSFNKFSGSVPNLNALTNLEWLSLNNNQLTGQLPDLSGLTYLSVLELRDNQFTGSVPDLSGLSNLTSLSLGSNQFSGTVPDLSSLLNLKELYLTDSNFSGPFPDLSKLTSLTEVYLGDNHLTGSIPDLSGLAELTWLDLSNNMLEGQIPNLSALTKLTWLSFGRNQLTGNIPDLSSLIDLTALILSHNLLTGPVPDLSALTKITLLDLSGNDLCLPQGLDLTDANSEVAAHLAELNLTSCVNAFLPFSH